MQDPFLMRSNSAAELFLIRHGDAIPGPDELIPSGIYDDLPLSRKGREQASALAKRLKDIPFTAIYSSPLLRCQQTAAPLAESSGLTPIIVEEIKEIYLSEALPLPTIKDGDDLTLLTEALVARQTEIVRVAGQTGTWDTLENSEPSKAFRKRVVDGIDRIAQQHISERVLVFAHGGVINAYVAEVLGLEKEFFFPCANTSLTVVRVSDSTRVLYVLNDIAHIISW